MAIQFVDHATEAYNVNPSTLTYNSASSGNLLAVIIGSKPTTRTTSPPAGLFDSGDHGTATGGTGSAGSDTGDMRMYFWTREADGTEPATSSLAWTGNPSPAIQSMLEFSKTNSGAWSIASAFGADNTQSTGTAAINIAAGSDPGYQAGDVIVIAYVSPTDAGTYTNPAITIPGCTVSNLAGLVDYSTATGNDGHLFIWSASVMAGTSTAAPQFQCDVDTLNASAGVALFARLREPNGAAPASDALVYDGADWGNLKIESYDGSGWS